MNKSELIAALNSKYYLVFPEVKDTRTYGSNLKYYKAIVFDEDGDSLRRGEVFFYVENEGGGGEVAHWHGAEPKPTPVTTFRDEVDTYIQSKITDGTIDAAFIESVDETKEIAHGKAFIVAGAKFEEKVVVFDRDSGNIRHRILT